MPRGEVSAQLPLTGHRLPCWLWRWAAQAPQHSEAADELRAVQAQPAVQEPAAVFRMPAGRRARHHCPLHNRCAAMPVLPMQFSMLALSCKLGTACTDA